MKSKELAIPEDYREFCEVALRVGAHKGAQVYLVGGLVRDLLLGWKPVDLDFLVEGDALGVAEEMAQELRAEVKRRETRFGTASLRTSNGVRIDVAMSRRESYERPGALPVVEPAPVAEDLKRRDFTVNAMAIALDTPAWGHLLDPLGGEEDLRKGELRILHERSFWDDPLRILRGVRLCGRLGYRFESDTSRCIGQALAGDVFRYVSPGRVGDELRLFLQEKAFPEILKLMLELGINTALKPDLPLGWGEVEQATVMARGFQAVDTLGMELPTLNGLVLSCIIPREYHKDLRKAYGIPPALPIPDRKSLVKIEQELQRKSIAPSKIHRLLKGLSKEALVCLVLIASCPLVVSRVCSYIRGEYDGKSLLTGKDLKILGYPRGPAYRKILEQISDLQLDGVLGGRDEAMRWLERNYPLEKIEGGNGAGG